jgi:hypothetical protein
MRNDAAERAPERCGQRSCPQIALWTVPELMDSEAAHSPLDKRFALPTLPTADDGHSRFRIFSETRECSLLSREDISNSQPKRTSVTGTGRECDSQFCGVGSCSVQTSAPRWKPAATC